jgi:hypothetical protein
MATLLLTALGTAIGGPIGGTIGALIGQQADAIVFGGGARQGPRLRELAITTSSYGQPIPRNFGRMRAAGTIIWSTDLIESKRKEKGRKGQPSTVSFSYSASFAVALSSTPIARLGRIWADGNLLRGAMDDLKVAGQLRFYGGHGDDPVDPLIAADKGLGAPAFRDCAYVVFEELELGDFGNRIPALSFELFADGSDAEVPLARLVPEARVEPAPATLSHARGFADEGGPLGSTLSAIDQVIPLVCTSGRDGLRIMPRAATSAPVATLPENIILTGSSSEESRHKQRGELPTREPAALRYYDEERDYQPGVQHALGSRRLGREIMIDFPATMTAPGAKKLANESANRARWRHETVLWRIGELDPRLEPGSVVRLPDESGLWLLRSWEWLDRGIELLLERLAPELATNVPSDPGEASSPDDQILPQTRLAAFEVPGDGNSNPATRMLFAAASAENRAWRGAALYLVQGPSLIPLGGSGARRAIMGVLIEPLNTSPALLFEPDASLVIELVAPDLEFEDADIEGLAAGANRILVGGEVLQFARATPLGDRRWQLRGLLRGRGGTEDAAANGHPAQTLAILLDDNLVALDPVEVPVSEMTRIAAIGTGDSDAVIAPVTNVGLSRRPPSPVHGRIKIASDQSRELSWSRRARGQWRWENSVDVPLVEEREAYIVGYGSAETPFTAWSVEEPCLQLSKEACDDLLARFGAADLWVKQIGTFDQSSPLLLDKLM